MRLLLKLLITGVIWVAIAILSVCAVLLSAGAARFIWLVLR